MNDDFIYRALPKVSKEFAQSLYARISAMPTSLRATQNQMKGLKWGHVAAIILGLLLLVAWSQLRVWVRYVPIGNLWLVELAQRTQPVLGEQPATIFVPTSMPTPEIWDGTSLPIPDVPKFELYFPAWIPERFARTEIPQEMTPYEQTLALWINDSQEKIRFFHVPIAGGMHPYAPADMYEEVLVTDQPAILIRGHLALKKPGEKTRKWDETLGLQLHWIIGEFVYALETFGPYVSEKDLIRMAESMEALSHPWIIPTP